VSITSISEKEYPLMKKDWIADLRLPAGGERGGGAVRGKSA